MEFKTQIATTIEQSKKLLELGIKPETADMTHHYQGSVDYYELKDIAFTKVMHLRELTNKNPILGRSGDDLYAKDIPAWSLHRLMAMIPASLGKYTMLAVTSEEVGYFYNDICDGITWDFAREGNTFDCIVECIKWLMKKGKFNKEYLV